MYQEEAAISLNQLLLSLHCAFKDVRQPLTHTHTHTHTHTAGCHAWLLMPMTVCECVVWRNEGIGDCMLDWDAASRWRAQWIEAGLRLSLTGTGFKGPF